MQDYTSKTLFVGIDVHKKTYVIACICEGELVKACLFSMTIVAGVSAEQHNVTPTL